MSDTHPYYKCSNCGFIDFVLEATVCKKCGRTYLVFLPHTMQVIRNQGRLDEYVHI